MPNTLKLKVYNQCVLPTMTYGAKTWTLNVKNSEKLARAQRAQECDDWINLHVFF